MTDHRYSILMLAEQMADQIYGSELCGLPTQTRLHLWGEAESKYWDALADRADQIGDRMRGGV